jgi:hypothetical protein
VCAQATGEIGKIPKTINAAKKTPAQRLEDKNF